MFAWTDPKDNEHSKDGSTAQRSFVEHIRSISNARLNACQREWTWIATLTGRTQDVWKRDQCSLEVERRARQGDT